MYPGMAWRDANDLDDGAEYKSNLRAGAQRFGATIPRGPRGRWHRFARGKNVVRRFSRDLVRRVALAQQRLEE